MSKINLKTDYEDGNILHGDELNINNNVTMLGVNDNFDRIQNLSVQKADVTYVNNVASTKVDLSTLNTRIQEINLTKADKSALATKADQSDVDRKANQVYVDSQLATKADKSYVESQLNLKVDFDEFDEGINNKVDKEVIGDLRLLKTEDKSSVVNAINSINTEAKAIATTETAGIVKPDGTTITIDQDGTIHSIGGGPEPGGTSDYNELSNKPQINNVEIKGNISLDDLGLMGSIDIDDKLSKKADINNVYNKSYIDNNVIIPLNDKVSKGYVDSQLESKADISDVYNKSAVDQLISSAESNIDAKLINKANVNDVYTKDETDSKVNDKADNLAINENQLQLMSGTKPIGDPVTVSVSGNEVAVSPEQPEDEDWKLWIDSDEVGNLGSEVVNVLSGNETDKAPSVQAINKALSYSTEEQVVGTWIDGKPLYRKVIDTGVLPNTTTKNVAHGISNAVFTKMEGIAYADNIYLPLPYVDSANKLTDILLRIVGGNIVIISGSDRSAFANSHVILEYIKTTDSVATTSLEGGGNE